MSEAVRKSATVREPSGRKSMVQELADLSAVVVAPIDDQTNLLMRELQRFRMRVRQVWPMPESVPGDADMVYCEYCTDLARRLPWIPGDARSALVVIVPTTDPNSARSPGKRDAGCGSVAALHVQCRAVEHRAGAQPVRVRAQASRQDRTSRRKSAIDAHGRARQSHTHGHATHAGNRSVWLHSPTGDGSTSVRQRGGRGDC